MSNIIKSLKSLQEAVAISSPSVAVLKEISRRLEVIIKEGVEYGKVNDTTNAVDD